MGLLDTLLGSGPETTTQTLDTLTPQQQAALNGLLRQLSGSSTNGRTFDSDVSVDPSNLQGLSLAALEERALALSDPNRNANLFGQASDTLMRLLDFESADAGINDFFNTNIRDPAIKDFSENILPSIGRAFGGANFFGSERQGTDQAAQKNLLESLTRSRESLAFNSRESDRNRALQALGLVPELSQAERGDSNELLNLLQAGESQTALSERNVEREFGKFLSEAGLQDESIRQLLAGINTQAIENVVTTTPGSSGILGPLLSAAGAAGGFGPLLGLGGSVAGKVGGNPSSSTTIGKKSL